MGGWMPIIPYIDLATCLYDTDPALSPHTEEIIHQLDLLDKKFMLVKGRYFQYMAIYFIMTWKQRKTIAVDKFQIGCLEIKCEGNIQQLQHR